MDCGLMKGWMNGWVGGCMDDEWLEGLMGKQMAGRMDG